MKRIILKNIELHYFKGIKSFRCEFDENLTTISGRNALGKTSLFDAFTYLLFGKDSAGNSQFGIKTLDENGNVIPRVEHEVSATLIVDGQQMTLCRRLVEKWVKKRGTASEEFTGNQEEYLINDVPYKKSEYQARISDICDEELFRMITSPKHFTSLAWDKQRQLLFSIAGNVSDEDIAADNNDFKELLEKLSNKSLEEFKKELAAKRKKLKQEIEDIPSRIDEVQRGMPEAQDWNEIKRQIDTIEKRLEEIDNQLTDIGSAQTAAAEHRSKLIQESAEVESEMLSRETEIKSRANENYYKFASTRSRLNSEIFGIEDSIADMKKQITANREAVDYCATVREQLIAEFKVVSARSITFKEDAFECPTCHRPFEPEQIEEIRTKAIAEFNEQKAADAKAINERGVSNNEKITVAIENIAICEAKIRELTARKATLEADPAFLPENTKMADTTSLIENDEKHKSLLDRLFALKDEIDKPLGPGNEEIRALLRSERTMLKSNAATLNGQLAVKAIIEQNKQRIAELERQLKEQSQLLADIEKQEFVAQEFSMARTNALTEKINSMFSVVKFSLFENQINGGVRETCVATLNGVPFKDINAAGKILVGLDIIQTLCKHYDVYAPIVLDNAERIDHNVSLEGFQLINLRVSEDNELIVK